MAREVLPRGIRMLLTDSWVNFSIHYVFYVVLFAILHDLDGDGSVIHSFYIFVMLFVDVYVHVRCSF